jgi:hypothetical protein
MFASTNSTPAPLKFKPPAHRTYYDYLDATGALSYQVIREVLADGGKTFKQRRPDGGIGWIWSIQGIEPLPFRLPQVLRVVQSGGLIFLVEGEKCADRLNEALRQVRANAIATCNNGGAGKWGAAQSRHLAGARVALLPDNDDPGDKHVVTAARHLIAAGVQSIKRIDLPELPPKGDIYDWLEAGHSIAELQTLYRAAVDYKPTENLRKPDIFTAPRPDAVKREKSDLTAWAQRALSNITGELAVLSDGRFGAMKAGANRLGTIAAHGLLSESECVAALVYALEANGYVSKPGKGQRAAENEARFYFRSGLDFPCDLPEADPSDDKETDSFNASDLISLNSQKLSAIPDTWRAAIGEYLPDSVQPFVERLNSAGLLVEGKSFSRQQALDLGLTRATVDRGLEAGEEVLWERITVLLPKNPEQEETEISIGKTVIGTQFRVLSAHDMAANLLRRAACRLWERCNPVEADQPLPSVRPGYFEALGYSTVEAEQIAVDIANTLAGVYRRQGNAERFSARQARAEYDRLKQSLAELHSTPLPDGWTYSNASEYRAVLARAIKEAQPDQNPSLKQWSERLGISPRSVPQVLARAGIASIQQHQERVVTSVDEAIRVGYELKGYPKSITSASSGGQSGRFDREKLAQQIAQHGKAVVSYQLANKQEIVTDEQPEQPLRKVAPARRPVPSDVVAALPAVEPAPKPTVVEPYFGPGYNPAYVRAWLVQACDLARGYKLHRDGRLIDHETGEVIAVDPTDQQLVDLLRSDPLLADDFLTEIGATVTDVAYHVEASL